jgi:hypothetical protein
VQIATMPLNPEFHNIFEPDFVVGYHPDDGKFKCNSRSCVEVGGFGGCGGIRHAFSHIAKLDVEQDSLTDPDNRQSESKKSSGIFGEPRRPSELGVWALLAWRRQPGFSRRLWRLHVSQVERRHITLTREHNGRKSGSNGRKKTGSARAG